MAQRRLKPAGEWLRRGALALVAAVLGYFSVTGSVAEVIERADPARAHLLAPYNGVITAALAEQQFAMSPQTDLDSKPAHLARLALRQDATAVDALNVLGLQAQLRNEAELTRELFRYSLLLSRRELRPQIWAIEEAVSRGDIKDALRAYDLALRTSSNAPALLFPVLASALSEPRVRAHLLPIMETYPVWATSFVNYLVASRISPVSALAFIREAETVGLPVNDDQRATLVNTISAEEDYDQAWGYYATFRPGADRRRSRDPVFALQTDTPTLFDWRVSEDVRLSAVILGGEKGGMLDFAVPPAIGGTLVSQTQLLPPGIYRLEGRSSGVSPSDRSRPYWALRCRDGRELGRVLVPSTEQDEGGFWGEFTVPANCREQILVLVARATDAIGGVLGQIDRVVLVPAQRAKMGTE